MYWATSILVVYCGSVGLTSTFVGCSVTFAGSVAFAGCSATVVGSVSLAGCSATVVGSVSLAGCSATVVCSVTTAGVGVSCGGFELLEIVWVPVKMATPTHKAITDFLRLLLLFWVLDFFFFLLAIVFP